MELEAGRGKSIHLPVTLTGDAQATLNGEVEVYVRPEAWEVTARDSGGAPDSRHGDVLTGQVSGRRFAGRENLVSVRLGQGVEIEVATERDFDAGDWLELRLGPGSIAPIAFASERGRARDSRGE